MPVYIKKGCIGNLCHVNLGGKHKVETLLIPIVFKIYKLGVHYPVVAFGV